MFSFLELAAGAFSALVGRTGFLVSGFGEAVLSALGVLASFLAVDAFFGAAFFSGVFFATGFFSGALPFLSVLATVGLTAVGFASALSCALAGFASFAVSSVLAAGLLAFLDSAFALAGFFADFAYSFLGAAFSADFFGDTVTSAALSSAFLSTGREVTGLSDFAVGAASGALTVTREVGAAFTSAKTVEGVAAGVLLGEVLCTVSAVLLIVTFVLLFFFFLLLLLIFSFPSVVLLRINVKREQILQD